jgi:hypothetical protein
VKPARIAVSGLTMALAALLGAAGSHYLPSPAHGATVAHSAPYALQLCEAVNAAGDGYLYSAQAC